MEIDAENKELLEELMYIETMVKDNPCGMPSSIMHSLKVVLDDFIGKHCINRANRTQVAKYFGVDVRTLSRWKNEYDDFPEGKTSGSKELSYSWNDIVKWKLRHKEIFADECPARRT